MHPHQVRDQLRKQPFEPFRIHISDGSAYGIDHPEMAVITARAIGVGVHATDDVEDIPERPVQLDPWHVTRLEPLPAGRRTGQRRRPER
jgi:hypothetical protein